MMPQGEVERLQGWIETDAALVEPRFPLVHVSLADFAMAEGPRQGLRKRIGSVANRVYDTIGGCGKLEFVSARQEFERDMLAQNIGVSGVRRGMRHGCLLLALELPGVAFATGSRPAIDRAGYIALG